MKNSSLEFNPDDMLTSILLVNSEKSLIKLAKTKPELSWITTYRREEVIITKNTKKVVKQKLSIERHHKITGDPLDFSVRF